MQKFKEFYDKHKMLLALVVSTVILCVSIYVDWFWIVGAVVLFFFYLTLSIGQMFCATMYFECFSGIGAFFVVSLLEMFLIVLLRYIKDVKDGKRKLFKAPLYLSIAMAAIWTVISFAYTMSVDGLFYGANLFFFLFVAYFLFIYHDEINIKNCFLSLFAGMLVASALCGLSLLDRDFPFNIGFPDEHPMFRLKLFTIWTTHVSMLCAFMIAYFVYAIFNKKCNFWLSIVAICSAIVVGVLTRSKAFLLIVAVIMVLALIYMIIKYKAKSLKVIVPVLAVLVVGVLLFHDKLFVTIGRFFNSLEKPNTIMNQILTGRPEIWVAYLKDIFSSPFKVLFGVGFFSVRVDPQITHNVVLQVLYRMGIVGIIMMLVLLSMYWHRAKNKPVFRFKNIFLFIAYLLFALEEDIISDMFMFFLFFSIMLLVDGPAQESQELVQEEESGKAKTFLDFNFDDLMNLRLRRKKKDSDRPRTE